MGSAQVFTVKTATMLKSTALAAYLAHAVLLNSSVVYWRWLVESSLTLVELWPSKMETGREIELSGEGRSSVHTTGSLRRRRCTWKKR